jgi:hypothetical protein
MSEDTISAGLHKIHELTGSDLRTTNYSEVLVRRKEKSALPD